MALGTQGATIGGVLKNLLVASDAAGDIAAAHVIVNSMGTEIGTAANPISTAGAMTQAGGPWSVSWTGQAVAASQSGAWSVGITGTVAIMATTLPLPIGAATAAKQPALGTAGSPAADVLTVQGAPSGAALVVAGAGAAGTAPINPPLSIAGVDGSGSKQHLLLDGGGRQQINWGASVATSQVSVGSTATAIVPARPGRRSVTIIQEGTVLVRLGAPSVTVGTGIPLPGTQYASCTFEGGAAIYGVVASGTQTVSYAEVF